MKKYLPILLGLLVSGHAHAHYCSNIWVGPARLVVKPETATVHLTGTSTATLKVFLQNNFPYRLFAAKMQGVVTNYTITVSPPQQDINPGQQVLYTFTVKHNTGFTGDVQVSTLNLQVQFRTGGWRNQTNREVNQSPTQAVLITSATSGGQQSRSLGAAKLGDNFPAATLPASSPYFGRTGYKQLISWFGYRFCYDAGGTWACGSQNCPSPCAEKTPYWTATDVFPQDSMRAGIDLGIRKAKLGSDLQGARDGASNALKGGSNHHKCLAAVVGGLLWKGATSTTAFETTLQASTATAPCKAAGLRALGKGTAGNCGTGQYYEQAACAAAEGLAGNDGPVTSILVPNAGDGQSTASTEYQRSLFYAYMLALVAGDRWGQGKAPSFYPPVGGPLPDGAAPKLDNGAPPKLDIGPRPDGWKPPEAGTPGQEGATPAGDGARPDDGGGCCRVAGAEPPATSLAVLAVLGLLALVGRARRRRR